MISSVSDSIKLKKDFFFGHELIGGKHSSFPVWKEWLMTIYKIPNLIYPTFHESFNS